MDFPLQTEFQSILCNVTLNLLSQQPLTVRIEVINPNKPNTKYTDRKCKLTHQSTTFSIRMPQSPWMAVLRITVLTPPAPRSSAAKTPIPLSINPPTLSFLYPRLNKREWTGASSKRVRAFIEFAQPFCENAGIMSAGQSIRLSDDWQFRIDYKDVLLDAKGKPSKTPARISADKGIIELNKSRFINYTVPMRMAILLHEFSHYYLNEKMDNEIEADLNAFFIYLGLGYPSIDGLLAFSEIFGVSDTPMNRARWDKIKAYVNNFEKQPFVIIYK